jgi:putative membrane protein
MKTNIPSLLRSGAFVIVASLATAAFAADPADTTTTTTPNTSASVSMPDTNANNATGKMAHHDKAFFEKAAKGGMKEVAVSQAVAGNLTNQSVRDFANMMVTDHTAANTELMALAARKGVTLPDESKKDAKLTEKWSEKGGNLDKKYIHEMVEDHEDTVKLFEKAAKSEDADVAAFAQKTLPTLQHHLQMAKDLKKSM